MMQPRRPESQFHEYGPGNGTKAQNVRKRCHRRDGEYSVQAAEFGGESWGVDKAPLGSNTPRTKAIAPPGVNGFDRSLQGGE